MRLLAFIVAYVLIGAGSAWSQELLQIDPENYCAARPGRVPTELFVFEPTQAAQEAFENVLRRYALSPRQWRLMQTTSDTAAHFHPVTKTRTILYSDQLLRDLETGNAWVAIGTLAHEVAHHLNFHLETNDSRRLEELEADNFAGALLFRMGATKEDTARVFRGLGGGGEYPAVEDRVTSATNGWQLAYDDDVEDDDVDEDDNEEDNTGNDDNYASPIVSDLMFRSDHTTMVRHEGFGSPGPGLRFSLAGRLRYSRPASVRARIRFAFPDGRLLIAHPSESRYRARSGVVVTGSRRVAFSGGQLNLSELHVDSMPYYVLNLVRGSYNYITAQATIFVDEVQVATSSPFTFYVVRQ